LQQSAQLRYLVGQSAVGVPHGDRAHLIVAPAKRGDLVETPPAASVAGHVQQHLDSRGQLTMQRNTIEPT
jgi:hypothetical protein